MLGHMYRSVYRCFLYSNYYIQGGDTSIHPVLLSSSSVKSQVKKSEQVKGQTVMIKVQ